MSSRPFPSKKEGTCWSCEGPIFLGQSVFFDQDNHIGHESCPRPQPAQWPQPPIQGTWPAPAGAGGTSPPSFDHFVFVGAYVPVESVSYVLEAIKRARGWT